MRIDGEREFELLKKIGFVRTGGSIEELEAANILKSEVESIGLKAEVEAFKVPAYDIKKAELEITSPYHKKYTVNGYGLSGNTPPDGIESGFEYVGNGEKVQLSTAKGKIVLVSERLTEENYQNLIDAGVAGFISYSGTVIDEEDKTDLAMRSLREKFTEKGKIPGLVMRAKDALEMMKKPPERVKIVLSQEEGEKDSHNVIAVIKGTEFLDEEIHFTAHYDSVPFSSGVYDNGSGSVIIMELLRYYSENPPKRTLKFIWCGSEEMGLLGSKSYVKTHEEELKKVVLDINIDVAGVILGENKALVMADESLCSMIKYLADEVGFAIEVRQDIYSSDSIPYTGNGVPAVNISRFGTRGTDMIHNRYDTIDNLSADSLAKLTEFVCLFSSRLINAYAFPVPREIPDNIVESVDKYLKKDKKSAPKLEAETAK